MVHDSTRQDGHYKDVLDYYMSEKFGLDWKEYDHERMQTFMIIMGLKAERAQREQDKAKTKSPGR